MANFTSSVFSHLLWKSLVQPAFDISQITSCLRSNLNQNQAFEEEFTLRKCWNFICHLSNKFNVFFSNVQVSRLFGFQLMRNNGQISRIRTSVLEFGLFGQSGLEQNHTLWKIAASAVQAGKICQNAGLTPEKLS